LNRASICCSQSCAVVVLASGMPRTQARVAVATARYVTSLDLVAVRHITRYSDGRYVVGEGFQRGPCEVRLTRRPCGSSGYPSDKQVTFRSVDIPCSGVPARCIQTQSSAPQSSCRPRSRKDGLSPRAAAGCVERRLLMLLLPFALLGACCSVLEHRCSDTSSL
jgi:hypothetical protein